MSDTGAAGTAREAAIGDQSHAFAESRAHDVGGGREHFLHAGSATGTLVADDHAVASLDHALEDAVAGFFLGFEDHGWTAELEHVRGHTGLLHHGATFGEVAVENGQAAIGGVGVLDRADHLVIPDFGAGHVLPQGLARDGRGLAMD